ncbi:MAG: SIMPL domain-containing protein [Pseudomonadota bacterium]
MRRAASLALAAALSAAFAAAPAHAEEPRRTLTILGQGEAAATPDLATIRIGVETRAETADAAMEENAATAAKLSAAAREAGIADRDIQTSGLTLYPVYENRRPNEAEPPKIVGYQAGVELALRLRDLDKVGEALGALVEAGANQMRGIAFAIEDDEALRDEARRAAIADARRKAELYAEAAGVALGPILSISEGGAGGGPVFEATTRGFAADAVAVERGETSVAATVRVVWAIGD